MAIVIKENVKKYIEKVEHVCGRIMVIQLRTKVQGGHNDNHERACA